MATIEERPSVASGQAASWRLYWRVGGRNGRKQSATFASRQLAEAANALCVSRRHKVTSTEVYQAVLGIDEHDQTSGPTLSEFAKEWIDHRRKLGDHGKRYLDGQASILRRRIIPRLGNLRLSNEFLTPEVVRDWVAWLRSQPGPTGHLQPSTVREAHIVLHGLLEAAVPKYLTSNPAAVRQNGSRRKSGLPQVLPYDAVFLTKEEIDLVVTACSPVIRDLVVVSLLTGLRLGELLELRVEDLTLTGNRKVLRVRRALKKDGTVGPPKSRRSRRDIGISQQVVKVLQSRVKDKPRHALVFTAPRGGQWSPTNLRKRHWLPALAQAQRCAEHPPPEPPKPRRGPRRGWRIDEVSTCDCSTRLHRLPRWHDLRHTHVSLCVEDGWDITRVSRRVGHDSIATTINIYGHLWDPEGDDRVDQLDRYVALAADEDG